MPERHDTSAGATGVAEAGAPPPAAEPVAVPRRRRRLAPAGLSPVAPAIGWLTAWGALAVALACLREAGVATGLALGIATGPPGADDGFPAGLWTMVAVAGAFLAGGYAAGRLARANALLHAGLAWCVAMLATGADALAIVVRDGGESVLERLGMPRWVHTGLSGTWEEGLALACVALVALAGSLVGGSLAAAANRTARADAGARPHADG